MSQALSLFDTMVVVEELPGAAQLNAALRSIILARQAASQGVKVSNIGGWQSDHDMVNWGGDAGTVLLKQIQALADRNSVDIRSPNMPRHRWVPEMWANVSPPEASNQLHTHPGAYWSAVYYIDDAGGGSGADLGGELVLEDPRMPMVMMIMPNLRFRRADGSVHEPQIALRPKNGRLIMFPSWLRHGVAPHRGTGPRISVAVNLMAVPNSA